MTGDSREHIMNRMSHAEGMHFEQIFWQELNASRKLHAFGKVADIEVLRLDSGAESDTL